MVQQQLLSEIIQVYSSRENQKNSNPAARKRQNNGFLFRNSVGEEIFKYPVHLEGNSNSIVKVFTDTHVEVP